MSKYYSKKLGRFLYIGDKVTLKWSNLISEDYTGEIVDIDNSHVTFNLTNINTLKHFKNIRYLFKGVEVYISEASGKETIKKALKRKFWW